MSSPLLKRLRRAEVGVDAKQMLGDPAALDLIARAIVDLAQVRGVTQVGGPEHGGATLIGAIVCKSWRRYPVAGFIVREAVKDHGTQKRIEGWFDPLAPTLLVADVTTTGASALAALAAVREAGGNAEMVLAVIDREAGAAEALAAEGCELVALVRFSELTG